MKTSPDGAVGLLRWMLSGHGSRVRGIPGGLRRWAWALLWAGWFCGGGTTSMAASAPGAASAPVQVAGEERKPVDSRRGRVVFLIGEDEYKTWETLPEFAGSELRGLGYTTRVVVEDPANKHRFPGLVEALREADLLVVSVRRRALAREELDAVRAHVAAGRPLVGLRTASHAFSPRANDADAGTAWSGFDGEVLGGNYQGHHGAGPAVALEAAPGAAAKHPILTGVNPGTWTSEGSLYRVTPLRPEALPILIGSVPGKPPEPVAWTHVAGPRRGRVFYTSLGHPGDFARPGFRRLLLNGMLWAMDHPIPAAPTERAAAERKPEKIEPTAPPLAPSESARRFTVVDGLEMELLLAEPDIAQPLQVSFDERGRMWVVEYRQYPAPAGLTLVSHDQFWRAVYDRVPPPPPGHFPGKDRVSIHEDTDGDGLPDKHTVFVDGLNIATSVAKGRGGVWVLNPPYLLFYPDRNDDDVPDGDPEVHLEGFGLEDTHSVANSLRWGPDGWLYAAQGSTVSGRVRRPGAAEEPVHTLGQNIWRYHPEQRRYEVFSEGGGNAFGVEVDNRGRIFSGHNGGNTRGFHYVQGGYLQKGFEKHGQLSNPYAFGYFPQMPHNAAERFTHTFVVYGGGAFSGALGRAAVRGGTPAGAGGDVRRAARGHDVPDGGRRVCRHLGGSLVQAGGHQARAGRRVVRGRLVRLPGEPLAELPGEHGCRERAGVPAQGAGREAGAGRGPASGALHAVGRVAGESEPVGARDGGAPARGSAGCRGGAAVAGTAEGIDGPRARLEALWGLNASGGFGGGVVLEALSHPEAAVREWAVRLVGDPGVGGVGRHRAAASGPGGARSGPRSAVATGGDRAAVAGGPGACRCCSTWRNVTRTPPIRGSR
jgi:type 1 glutamine amidotransferase